MERSPLLPHNECVRRGLLADNGGEGHYGHNGIVAGTSVGFIPKSILSYFGGVFYFVDKQWNRNLLQQKDFSQAIHIFFT